MFTLNAYFLITFLGNSSNFQYLILSLATLVLSPSIDLRETGSQVKHN